MRGELKVGERMALIVPKSAVIHIRDSDYVIVRDSGKQYRRVHGARTRASQADRYAITAGLERNVAVVTDGALLLNEIDERGLIMTAPGITSRFIDHAITSRGLVLFLCALLLALGAYSFQSLPIEAYPNIAPLNIQIITQWAGRSTLEIERQLTIPIETAVAGVPDVDSVRSVSLFGLSVVTDQVPRGRG